MTTQLDLPMTTHRKTVRQRIADAALLMATLRGRGWTIKSEIMSMLGWTERRVQDAKEQSRGRIISTSQNGYCLAREATQDEFSHAIREQSKRRQSLQRTEMQMIKRFHEHHSTPIVCEQEAA